MPDRPSSAHLPAPRSAAAAPRGRRWGLTVLALAVLLGLGVYLWRHGEPGASPAGEKGRQAAAAVRSPQATDESRRLAALPALRTPQPGGAAAVPAPEATPGPRPSAVTLVDASETRTVLAFELGSYAITEQGTAARRTSQVTLPGAYRLSRKGFPDLPCVRANLIVPAGTTAVVEVTDAAYDEIACAPPEPSPGFVSRAAPGPAVPALGAFYGGHQPYPETAAAATAPFQIRHTRGVGVLFHPFQYFPDRGTLRVYRRIRAVVRAVPAAGAAVTSRPVERAADIGEFAVTAAGLFLNSAAVATRGDAATADTGVAISTTATGAVLDELPPRLLVIVPDTRVDAVSEFVEWKRERGLDVQVATYPGLTGTGAANLAQYIRSQYELRNITYVLLVGDSDDIPVYRMSPIPSDTIYTRVSGDDYYQDLLLSRVPASTPEAIRHMLGKAVAYERDPDSADAAWYTRGCMVASNEGAATSAFKLNDWEVLDGERAHLLDAGFVDVSRVYDPGATTAQVTDAWNLGVSLIYYLGHGSETTWYSSGFGTPAGVAALQNGRRLPFVVNGNCRNGNFTRIGGDCLAEALLKAGTPDAPAGCVATLASTTNMDWDPPIVMIQAFTGYLTHASPLLAGGMTFAPDPAPVTAGALTTFSVQRAMDYCYSTPDEGSTAATTIMEQTHLLGDCTLQLRTRQPLPLSVEHAAQVVAGYPFHIRVTTGSLTPVAQATVCLYQAPDQQLTGTTDSNGEATLSPGNLAPGSVRLTVYQANAVPLQEDLAVAGDGLVIASSPVLPTGFAEEPFAFTHEAHGGAPPYTWSFASAAPDWLALDVTTGTVAGTPPGESQTEYVIQVSDTTGALAQQRVRLRTGWPVSILTASIPDATVAEPYSVTLQSAGSFTPIAWTVTSGTLPPGVSFSTGGTLAGTPDRAGSYAFAVTATDQQQRTAQKACTLRVLPSDHLRVDTPSVLPTARKDVPWQVQLRVSGGSGTGFVWSLAAGALPAGLALTADGLLHGTPLTEGTAPFTLAVHDDSVLPVQTIQAFSLTVTRGVYFPTTALPAAVAGQAYSAQVPAGGSFTPFQFAAPAGSGYALTTVPSTFTTAGTLQPWRTDETEWDLDLGFAFPFFGTPFTRCRVGDDGYLVFGTASPDPYWDATPEQFGNLQIIAPFWTDLVISDAYPDTGIWVERGANAITVRWRGRDYHVPTDVIEFAVTLSADGRITCSYGSVATSNRVVIGLAAGSAGMKQLIFSHAWDGTTSDTVTEWSGHADLCFLWPKALPGWLHVTAAGTLSGTPPTAGSWVFTLQATDTAANVAVADFTLVVNDLPTADTNQDGHVDNREILAFAERWAAETVPETLLRAEIERWRTGGTARAAAPAAVLGAAPAAPRPRLGEILVADVPLRDAADAGRLTAAGYDVAGAQDGHATVYGTPDEIEQLRRDGYAPVVTESQWVGEAGPRRRSANRTASGYTTYDALTTALQDAAARYPQLCRLVSLGTSVQGRDLWAVRISAVPEAGALPSEVRFVGGMHGDEPLGGEVCLRLLSWLLGEYGGPSAEAGRITKLLDATAIWIVPSANPDGLVAGTRYNVNGLDLNRAFPDRTVADIGNAGLEGAAPIRDREPEVAALMEWSRAHRFALSLQLHTGSLVVAYPYGSRDANAAGSSLTADDALFHALALAYAALNPTMRDQSPFADGVVNAATWYPTTGEMADWSYTYLGTLDMTAELSLVRSPLAAQIAQVWDANREALLTHAETARRGVFGTVTDSITHAPLRAEIRPASGGQAALTHLDGGTYQRVLAPGYQTLEVSAPGYWTATPEISVDAAPAVSPFAVELLPAPHLAARSLPMPDPGAGQPLTVRLDWRAADAHALHAFILTEVLPRDTTYIPGSAVDYDARPLDAPRIGNGRCSWLFWGRQLHDGQVSYQVLPPPAAERLHFQGVMETATGTIASTGATLWSAPEEFRFHLQTGWNMISLPVEPDPADAGTIFAALRGAQLWRWTGVVYELAPSLRAGQGYWIYAKGPGEFVVRGPPPVECWADLHPGWNLVGALTDRRLRANDSVPGPCWSWDGRQYQVATQLVTGQAYWVYTATATRIRLAP